MTHKKTKGGLNKLIFTPKAPPSLEIPPSNTTPTTSISSTQKEKKPVKKQPNRQNYKQSAIAFSAFTKPKDTKNTISLNQDNEQIESFDDHYDPQYLNVSNSENLFDDDIMYIFSGIEKFKGKVHVDGKSVYYEYDEIMSEMVVRNVDCMNVVLIDENNVKEVGSVYNAYTLCRKEL